MASHQQRPHHPQPAGSAHEGRRQLEQAAPTEGSAARREQFSGPFSMMRRFGEQMDRMFDDLFSGFAGPAAENTRWPELEVSHQDNKLVVRADIPGLKKEDVNVELRDNELRISGERRSESEQKEGDYYRSERSYGSFSRTIPLPQGVKPETASATFDNGVLRIEMDAPTKQGSARRVEVREGSPH